METLVYSELLKNLKTSASLFLENDNEISEELEEDILAIINIFDISKWSLNVDGVVKDFSCLLTELENANESGDQQKCIESIAMLRCAISDIASAFSNAMDSMENLVVSIRDKDD